MLGKPLWFDQSTRLGRRLGYPKVCVEMNVDYAFLASLKLVPDKRFPLTVNLEYCHRPVICEKCNDFGHECKVALVQEVNQEEEVETQPTKASIVQKANEGTTVIAPVTATTIVSPEEIGLQQVVENLVTSITEGNSSGWGQLSSDKKFELLKKW
ncbi:unnamed protein product [Linum trigynum]|uniref:Uncharacterized protein n=1 Tax=Linum trigynum TaxID=586398 RepID=A0AAV2E4R4_9ROSI